jgi:homoserine kinase
MIKVRVPASTSNLGPGFDAFGLALSLYLDFSVVEADDWTIEVVGEGEEKIPRNEKNLAYRALCYLFERVGQRPAGLYLKMENAIPVSRGLGSSATAIIAGLTAGNYLLGEPFSRKELIKIAIELEGHPDNVTASFLGGFTLCYHDGTEWHWQRYELSEKLRVLVLVPSVKLSTREARQVLPETVSRKDAIFNLAHSSLLALSLLKSDWKMLTQAMQDRLHQPYRLPLLPEMEEGLSILRGSRGVLGASLSGAGPSLLGFYLAQDQEGVAESIKENLKKSRFKFRTLWLEVNRQGVSLV